MSQDATRLLDQIRRDLEQLHNEAEEAKHYIERAEPQEARRPLDNGTNTLRNLEQTWAQLHQIIERL